MPRLYYTQGLEIIVKTPQCDVSTQKKQNFKPYAILQRDAACHVSTKEMKKIIDYGGIRRSTLRLYKRNEKILINT
jgi:hypothetical protein